MPTKAVPSTRPSEEFWPVSTGCGQHNAHLGSGLVGFTLVRTSALSPLAGWPPLSPRVRAFLRVVVLLPRAITYWVRSGRARRNVGLHSGLSMPVR